MNDTIKLSDIRYNFPFHINRNICLVVHLMDLVEEITKSRNGTEPYYKIDWDVYLPKYNINLQRGFVWTDKQKSDLILSILKDIPIPPLTAIMYEHKVIKIIDGKQRLNAMIGFMENKFPITINNKNYFYSDLPKDIRTAINLYSPVANVGYEYDNSLISDDDKIKWFLYVNYTGTVQDSNYLNSLTKLINHE